MTGVLIKRGNLVTETDKLRGKTTWRDTGRAPCGRRSLAVTSQAWPGPGKLEEEGPSPAGFRGVRALPWRLSRQRIHPQCGRPGFGPWVERIPWRRAWQPTPVFLPGESPWTEEPGGLHSPRGCKQLGTTERPGTQHTRSSKCLARIKHFRCSKPLKLCYCAMAALGNQWNHHIEIVLTTLPCEHITGVVLFPPDQQP